MRISPTCRLVCDLPQPVRTAHTATTGLEDLQHGRLRAEEAEVGARRQADRRLVHHVLVATDRSRRTPLRRPLPTANDVGKFLLSPDRDALRVPRPGERRRVDAVVDAGNLRGGERDDFDVGVAAENGVEVVEVASTGSHDDHLAHADLLALAIAQRALALGITSVRPSMPPA